MVVSAREWNVCGRVRERGRHSNAGVCVGGCCCCGGAGRKGEAGFEPTHKKARVAATARYLL